MKQTTAILRELNKLYPSANSELNFSNSYELLAAVMLSAQCTDKKVNEVTPELFKHYPNFTILAEAKLSDLEKIIRPINYYKTKAKNLISTANTICLEHQGKLPKEHSELVKLAGVGQKTANVVVSELGTQPALAVDTHVFRVSKRLGLSSGKNVKTTEQELTQIFPKKDWRRLHHGLILHGRRVCKAQNPDCNNCSLLKLCEQNF